MTRVREGGILSRMKQFIALLIIFTTVSCTSVPKDEAEIITRPFSAVDSDRQIVLSLGRIFEIMLPSNPTTGYGWNLSVENPSIVLNRSHKYLADSKGRVGVGGKTNWTLKAVARGDTTLTFSYQRPWEEKTEPTKVVTFSISVH
mgnify:CR=1 FL=1|jgi:inhibitor of cysteine peptidase